MKSSPDEELRTLSMGSRWGIRCGQDGMMFWLGDSENTNWSEDDARRIAIYLDRTHDGSAASFEPKVLPAPVKSISRFITKIREAMAEYDQQEGHKEDHTDPNCVRCKVLEALLGVIDKQKKKDS
jgi:hypothetical protein